MARFESGVTPRRARVARTFTDAIPGAGDPLPACTPIKAVHFTEVFAALVSLGGSPTWGAFSPPTAGAPVLAEHMNALRVPAGLPPIGPGETITVTHLNEVRAKVRELD
jgi:hypothetical protein